MMSAICYAAMLILNKKAAWVDGMENSLLQMVSAAATVLLLLGIQGEIGMTVAAAQWPWILLLRIVNTGFGCWCYFLPSALFRRKPLQCAVIWSRWLP